MKKSTLSLALVLIFCAGLLSGCGGESSAQDSPSGNTESPTQNSEPSDSSKESSQEITTEPEEDSGKSILRSMPYYGDVDRCTMTAEQALAYAQLLADGIAGKVTEISYQHSTVNETMNFWDTPFTVFGYSGEYQTDRANAILGSFAGDGQPYICVLSSDHPDCGFDIYYSDGGAAQFVYGAEAYAGRWYAGFNLDSSGKMTISTGGSGGAASHYAERLILENGEAKTQHSWSEEYNYDTGIICVTDDGVESYYTPEEYDETEGISWEDLPDTPYTHIPLRDMITYLNEYAAAKGSTETVAVQERSSESAMVMAMLAALDAETITDYDWMNGDARLVDLDKDGVTELLTFNGSQAWLHWWENGQLQTREIGYVVGGWIECWLCRDTETGELGIEWRINGGGEFVGGSSTIFYFSGDVSFSDYEWMDNPDTVYSVNGQEVTQAEHDAVRTRNQRVEELIVEGGTEGRVEQVRAALMAML